MTASGDWNGDGAAAEETVVSTSRSSTVGMPSVRSIMIIGAAGTELALTELRELAALDGLEPNFEPIALLTLAGRDRVTGVRSRSRSDIMLIWIGFRGLATLIQPFRSNLNKSNKMNKLIDGIAFDLPTQNTFWRAKDARK